MVGALPIWKSSATWIEKESSDNGQNNGVADWKTSITK